MGTGTPTASVTGTPTAASVTGTPTDSGSQLTVTPTVSANDGSDSDFFVHEFLEQNWEDMPLWVGVSCILGSVLCTWCGLSLCCMCNKCANGEMLSDAVAESKMSTCVRSGLCCWWQGDGRLARISQWL